MFGMLGKRKTPSQNGQSIPSLPSTGSAKGERDRIPLARRACVAPAHRGVALEHEARVVAAFANGKNFA